MPIIFRQRLWLFLLLGVILFGIVQWQAKRSDYIIHIPDGIRAQLAAQWEAQTGRPPSASQLESLLSNYVREEILVREAQALGLADGDVIIRRRLVQKLEYLLDAQTSPPNPDDAMLRDFMATHAARYRSVATISFRHIQLQPQQAVRDVQQSLAAAPERWRDLGAPAMSAREWLETSQMVTEQNFGIEFAQALMALGAQNVRGWYGPVRSIYARHLVEILNYDPPKDADFASLRPRLVQDWMAEQIAKARADKIAALRDKYQLR